MTRSKGSFGELLRSARIRNAYSQDELAKRLKVSQGTISNWEKDKSCPDKEQLDQLSKLLGIKERKSEKSNGVDIQIGPSPLGAWLNRTRVSLGLSIPELAAKSGLTPPALYRIEYGETANPRHATIKRLERALDAEVPGETVEEISEEAKVEGLGEFTDFDPHSPDELPSGPGVYVFYDLSKRPIYVGESQNMRRRISEHQDKFWFKSPIVESGSYIEIADNRLRKQIETLLIKFLKSNAVLNIKNVER